MWISFQKQDFQWNPSCHALPDLFPSTGIIDGALMLAYLGDAESHGARLP
jgi:hypothetical protein